MNKSNDSAAATDYPNRSRYLDLLKKILINTIYLEHDPSLLVVDANESPEDRRSLGRDWPTMALSMVGMTRLNHLQSCIEDVISRGVPGDLIETGVWRGGATILMRAVLAASDVSDRIVWAADSFCGLPPPNPERFPVDEGDPHHTFGYLSVSLETVRANFEKFGLLDDQVRFVEGFFSDTLPTLPAECFSVLRLDGDMYESTWVSLENLYPRLSQGGYVIIDDYGVLPRCAAAVEDYRFQAGITTPMHEVDWSARYWIK
jgi:O-methyltransferase